MAESLEAQLRFAIANKRLVEVGWRLLDTSKIGAGHVLEGTFSGSRGQSHRHHFAWDAVYTRVT
jgi:hypothetical protein